MDRPELQWSVRRCAKSMSAPTDEDMERLKRIARYLKGRPRVRNAMMFKQSKEEIIVRTCSDWAGKKMEDNQYQGGPCERAASGSNRGPKTRAQSHVVQVKPNFMLATWERQKALGCKL